MPRLLKAALINGATPLIVGIAIYIYWRLTRADWLVIAGLVNIVVGLVMFVSGVICLSMRSTKVVAVGTDVRWKLSRSRKLAWVLLILNFPVAILITLSVIDVETRYTVTIINESISPIQSFIINAPGVRVEMAPISSKGKARKHLHFTGDGSLDFEIRSEHSMTNGVIEEYVTPNLGGSMTVYLKTDGSIEVLQQPR